MSSRKEVLGHLFWAALIVLSAAVFTAFPVSYSVAMQGGSLHKQNVRPNATKSANEQQELPSDSAELSYGYEFTQPQFHIRHILIEHDGTGRGKITFERLNEDVPIIEPLELSPSALARISTLWQSLRFIESEANYQSDRQFPHLGTIRLKMALGARRRTAEFNWTNNTTVSSLVNEYRRIADQAILIFDISVARENQPLNAPKLMERLESLLRRDGVSDPHQLVPLLQDISIDEHLPLIARHHAERLLKKIKK